jgi:hypothetical protein
MITHARSIILPDWAGKPVEEEEAGWPVIRCFEPQERDFQVGLADLSHRPKAIVHGPTVRKLGNFKTGQVLWTGRAFFACLKPDEVFIYDLTGPMNPDWPDAYYTDLTEGLVLLALFGPRSLEVMQRLVSIDVELPEQKEPFYLATRSHAIIVHILNPKTIEPGFFLVCARSHGQNLFNGCVHAGRHLGLRPAGMETFRAWLTSMNF